MMTSAEGPQRRPTPHQETVKPSLFAFTADDLYNYLHKKNPEKVETINFEEYKERKKEKGKPDSEKQTSFCRICNKLYAVSCPVHPSYLAQPTEQAEEDRCSYAIKSFPDVVQLCKSSIPGEKYGVAAKQHIPVGTWIGPYEGKRVAPDALDPTIDSSYLWEIYSDGKLLYYLDATDENVSSWMRFIRCARHRSEQNLFAFQYCGNIYYRAFRDIPIGTELLVWYEDMYPQYFGIPIGIHDLNSMGSRPHPIMAAPFSDAKPITSGPPPTSIAARQATPGASHGKSSSGLTRADESKSCRPSEQEALNKKQQLKQKVKRKVEENENNPISKKHKLQQIMQRSDSSKLLLQKLEETRNEEKTDLPCEWPRVAEGEFILSNSKPGMWYCNECDRSFNQRSTFQMHVCSQNSHKPYQCGNCSQRFCSPNELRTHAVVHSGKKPFKCGFCSRSFAGATTLNNHVRTHTGEKPFTCNRCCKAFSQISQLSRHKRAPYECFA